MCGSGRGMFAMALTIFSKTWLFLVLYGCYMVAVSVYCTATRLEGVDLYFNFEYTLYSMTVTSVWLLYISCLYTLYVVTFTSIWRICQLEVYIIQRYSYKYTTFICQLYVYIEYTVRSIRHMSARSIHYTAGQLQIYDFYMSAVCIRYVSSQLRVYDSYISAVSIHFIV
jgi:hypothetical protein